MRFKKYLAEPVSGIYWPKLLQVANCYLVMRPDGDLDLVDTAVLFERWILYLHFSRLQKLPRRVLLTHSHADHAGNAKYFKNKFKAEVICSSEESPYLAGTKYLKPRDYSGSPFFTRMIQVGDVLLGHPKCENHQTWSTSEDGIWKFILIEGHTPGSGAWLHIPSKSVFLGDCLLNCNPIVYPHKPGLHFPFKYFCEDWSLAKQNLLRILSVDFENAFFGHGEPIVGNAKEKIHDFLSRNIDINREVI